MDLATKRILIDKVGDLSIKAQCKLVGLNRSSYYLQPAELDSVEQKILNRIDEIYTEHPYFGMRRMASNLRREGYNIGRKKIRRYYKMLGIKAIYPKMNLSKRNQAHKVYPYLLKGLKISDPNQVWSMDITYIRLRVGFVYLCAVIDWYSRHILSWRLSISLENEFCVAAVKEALEKYGKAKIFNTDQGVQFTSHNFVNLLEANNIAISMDGKGRALDNVFIERFWRSLKQEKIYRLDLGSVREAKAAIAQYMIFYNNYRLHQALDYQTPAEVYFKNQQQLDTKPPMEPNMSA